MSIEEGRKFWAFLPPKRPPVPRVKDTARPCGAIDRFVLAKLEEKKFQASSDADPHTLLRRLTFDLTGLPPTVQEIEAFVCELAGEHQTIRQPSRVKASVPHIDTIALFGQARLRRMARK